MVSLEGGTGVGVLAPKHYKKHKKRHCKPCGPTMSHGATGVGVLAPKHHKKKVRFANPWMTALKRWNGSHNKGSFCIPKKGSSDYAAVKRMM